MGRICFIVKFGGTYGNHCALRR